MKQIIQYQKTGEISVEDLPDIKIAPGGVLVQNCFSLISAGTERTSVETAQASLLGKAKSRPDLVKQVVDNVKKDGLFATYKKVMNRLDNYKELGYSSAGIVIESSVDEFKPGDRVACAGGGYASHSELVFIPKNLVVKVPENVSLEESAFTTLGAIALQGVRQANPKLGENVAVIGLGLIGLITVQLLKANGCKVIGFDINDKNFQLAHACGCAETALLNDSSENVVNLFTNYYGTDAVIITASTKANDPIEKAITFARQKSKIVYVGVAGMNIPRQGFYEKELEITISCSYGPGRYDNKYEEKGIDYPIGYVRWTEKRNMEAIVQLLSQNDLDFKKLITHKIPIEEGLKAYDLITDKIMEPYLGILINYPIRHQKDFFRIKNNLSPNKKNINKIKIGFIGAGNFAQTYLLPFLTKENISFSSVATRKPINAKSVARKFAFTKYSSDPSEIINDETINTVFIVTNHSSHSNFVLESLKKRKNIFVEKPLCIDENELLAIMEQYQKNSQNNEPNFLMVGYNRRFSRPIGLIKKFFNGEKEPMYLNYRINAGFIPKTNWYQSLEEKGRIIGEACHFIDTLGFLTGAKPISVFASSVADYSRKYSNDNVSMTINFSNGSIGNVIYLANGSKVMEKEYLEVFVAGKSAKMWDFKEVELFNSSKKTKKKFSGGKGHAEEMKKVVEALKTGKEHLIPFEELILTTLTSFKALESIKEGTVKKIEF